jgi:hypothetical protein
MIARATLGLVLVAAPAAAQGLAARIAAAGSGTVRLTFAARPGVCGSGRNVAFECHGSTCGRHAVSFARDFDGAEVEYDCEPGPVRVSLTVHDGSVAAVRTYVGGRWVTPAPGVGVTDCGTVATREAVSFLLGLAAHDDGRVGEDAIFPATIADSVTVWPALLQLARNTAVRRSTRRQAVFWLGQAAGEAATRGLSDLVNDASADREVKEHAVFALSQRPHDEGVPVLIRIARSHPDHAVRRKALFWLGQSDDPRALALFEELLTQP